jgi:hypothetical protein
MNNMDHQVKSIRERQGNVVRRFKKELIIAGIILGVFIITGGVWGMNKKEYRKSFTVEPGTVLKVYNKNGSIDVSGWDRNYIEVEAIKKKHWLISFVNEPTTDVTTGNEFVVRTLCSTFLSTSVSVHYRITVPKSVLVEHVETSTGKINVDKVSGNVEVKTATGEIQIHEINGFVKAITSTGKINIDNVLGNVDAKISTGEIQIHEINGFVKAVTSAGKIDVAQVSGDVDARTVAGGIQVHKVSGFVKAVTRNGKIDISRVDGLSGASNVTGEISVEVPAIRDSLEISSTNGSITVFLSPDIAAQLEASTSNGCISYGDLPLTLSQSSRTRITGRLGEGGGRINIKNSTGSINLKKLASGDTDAGI